MPDLLSPISAALPCGDDLTFSSDFDQIQELRREDDPTLDQGEWVTALKSADWPAVVARCDALLAERSKDLRLLVWRVEALARLRGHAGLSTGLADCVAVCSRYWDGLHPLPDDGDLEQRAGALRWLLALVQRSVRSLPVTQAPAGRFSLAELDDARQLQQAIDRDPDQAAVLSLGKPAPALVQKARRDTPPAAWRANVEALMQAREQLAALQALTDPLLGEQAPSFVPARQALDDALHVVERFAREAGVLPAAAAPAEAAQPALSAAVDATATAPAAGHGELRTRDDALAQLRAVAEFFRRTEPHSPVAFLADKAARWGEMPLHAWLKEVIKDGGSLAHLEELLGVPPAEPN